MESERTPGTSPDDVARLLAQMRQATSRARPFVLPLWYHVAVGVVFGALVALQAVPLSARVAGYLVLAGMTVVLVRFYRRVSGRVVYGFRRGRTLPIALAMLATTWAMLALVTPGLFGPAPVLSPWLGGLITFVVAVPAELAWGRAYRAETSEGP
jgi:hypothetical protein